MTIPLLEGTKIYEQGELKGKLELHEGERAGPFVIVESVGSLEVVEPSLQEKESVLEASGKKHNHLLTLEGRFQMADTKNRNGRVYPASLWEKVFNDRDLMKSISDGEMLGELDHPKDGETSLKRVCGLVTKIWRNPNNLKEVMGRFTVFDNDMGRQLKAIHEGGGKIGVSSRGTGSVVRLGGKDVVQEDFKLKTWDVVHGPSTPGAYPEEVTESTKEAPEIQETTGMSNLDQLKQRFEKIKSRDVKSLHRDAISLLAESVNEIQAEVVDGDFGSQTPAAALFVNETAAWIKEVEPLLEEKEETEGDAVHLQEKKVEVPSRPDNEQAVTEAVVLLDLTPKSEIAEALKTIRSAYKDAFQIKGKLNEFEVSAINESAKNMVIECAKLDESCPLIIARVGKTLNESDEPTVIEARSEKELKEKLHEATKNGSFYVEIDRSAAVHKECSDRFGNLLEAQTIKAKEATERLASNQADVTDLSAKLRGAVKLIEGYSTRCKKLESEKKVLEQDLDAACTFWKRFRVKFLQNDTRESSRESRLPTPEFLESSRISSRLIRLKISSNTLDRLVRPIRSIENQLPPRILRKQSRRTRSFERRLTSPRRKRFPRKRRNNSISLNASSVHSRIVETSEAN